MPERMWILALLRTESSGPRMTPCTPLAVYVPKATGRYSRNKANNQPTEPRGITKLLYTEKKKNSSLSEESPQCEQNPLPGREQKEESDLKTKHRDIK